MFVYYLKIIVSSVKKKAISASLDQHGQAMKTERYS